MISFQWSELNLYVLVVMVRLVNPKFIACEEMGGSYIYANFISYCRIRIYNKQLVNFWS